MFSIFHSLTTRVYFRTFAVNNVTFTKYWSGDGGWLWGSTLIYEIHRSDGIGFVVIFIFVWQARPSAGTAANWVTLYKGAALNLPTKIQNRPFTITCVRIEGGGGGLYTTYVRRTSETKQISRAEQQFYVQKQKAVFEGRGDWCTRA